MLIDGALSSSFRTVNVQTSTPELASSEASSSAATTGNDAAYFSSKSVEEENSSYRTLAILRAQLNDLKSTGSAKDRAFVQKVSRSLDALVGRINEPLNALSDSGTLNGEDSSRLEKIRSAFETKLAELGQEFVSSDRPSLGRFQSAIQSAFRDFKSELEAFMEAEGQGPKVLRLYKPPEGGAISQKTSGEDPTIKRFFEAFDKAFKEGLSDAKEDLGTALSFAKDTDSEVQIRDYERYVAYYQRVAENGGSASSST